MKPKTGSSYDNAIPDPGTHRARCFWIVDFGQQETEFNGVKSMKNQVFFGFELSDTEHVFKEENGPQPFMLRRTFTNTLDAKGNMRKFLESWMGRPFSPQEEEDANLFIFGGKACMVTCVHELSKKGDKTYANISTITPLPKESRDKTGKIIQAAVEPPPPLQNKMILFDMEGKCYVGGNSLKDAQEVDVNTAYKALPEWMQKTIAKSPEWQALTGTGQASISKDDTARHQRAAEPTEF